MVVMKYGCCVLGSVLPVCGWVAPVGSPGQRPLSPVTRLVGGEKWAGTWAGARSRPDQWVPVAAGRWTPAMLRLVLILGVALSQAYGMV